MALPAMAFPSYASHVGWPTSCPMSFLSLAAGQLNCSQSSHSWLFVHLEEQPSTRYPPSALATNRSSSVVPSSHCSPGSTIVFPQTGPLIPSLASPPALPDIPAAPAVPP